MKKSKVLVPAMALLLFSTAASITGTVAWFSSTRVFNTSVGSFSVKEIDGNLTCTVTKDVGTVEGDSANTVKVPTANNLIDASLNREGNASQIDVYRKSREATSEAYFIKYNKGETGTNDWLYRTVSETEKYYLAVSWNMEFTYTFNAETAPLDVILDLKQSKFKGAVALGANEVHDTAKGFRIAFITSTGIKVWGNRELGTTGSEYANIQYVKGEASTAVGNYAGTNYFLSDNNYDVSAVQDGVSHANLPNLIGSITKGTGDKGTLDVTCVAWFEGTDPDVVSSESATALTKLQTLSADLFFFGRSGVTPTPEP